MILKLKTISSWCRWGVLPSMVLGMFTPPTHGYEIRIDDSKQFQQIEGFGGTTWARGSYKDYSEDLVKDLGVTVVRLVANRTLDGNWSSTARDINDFKKHKLDYDVKFIASTWTPDASLKVNNNIETDTSDTGLCRVNKINCPNRLKDDTYDDFARWCAHYVKNVKRSYGVDLYGYSFTNEPYFAQTYASCIFTQDNYVKGLKETKKAFVDSGLSTIIFGPEDMAKDVASGVRFYAKTIADDPQALAAFDRLAVHGYTNGRDPSDIASGAGIWKNVNLARSKFLKHKQSAWQTETSGFPITFDGALSLATSIQQALVYGKISLWTFWTFSNYSKEGQDDDFELMDAAKGKSSRYYVSKNFYRYIRPEAVMVQCSMDSDSTKLLASAFVHQEQKTMTVVIINNTKTEQSATIVGDNLPSSFERYVTTAQDNCASKSAVSNTVILPAESVTTLYGKNFQPRTTAVGPDRFYPIYRDFSQTATTRYVTIDGRHIDAALVRSNQVKGVYIAQHLNAAGAVIGFKRHIGF
jgi:O-glycosyl hydrolase